MTKSGGGSFDGKAAISSRPYSRSLTGGLPSAMASPSRSRKSPSMALRTLSFKTPLRIA